MATRTFMVDKPVSGANETVDLPKGEATTLSFNTSEIQGMQLSDNGQLTISFNDGGSLTINNFRELANSEVSLTLEDGSTINSEELYETLVAELPPSKIAVSGEGEAVAYEIQSGHKYNIDLAGSEPVDVKEQDGALLITFDNNGTLVLKNFEQAMASDVGADVTLDGEFLTLREFADGMSFAVAMRDQIQQQNNGTNLRNVRETTQDQLASLAEDLAGIEPAAGEGGGANGGRGGFGFGSTFQSTPIDPLNDVGPIGPTALEYQLPEFDDPLIIPEDFQQPDGPVLPLLEVADVFVYEDGSVTLAVWADPDAADAFVTLTISGIPAGWGVLPNGGTYNAAAGTWTVSAAPGATVSGGPTLSPPADTDGDLPNLIVTATNTSTTTGLTSGTSDSIAVTTDAVADVPNLNAADSVANEDDPAPLNITTSVNDTDGSETITTVYVRGVPAGFTLSAGVDNGGGEWQLTQAELAGLEINAPANFFGTINLDVETIAEETNKSDTDFDFTNDVANNTDQMTVTWKPVIDPPSVVANNGVDDAQVKEDGTVDVPLTATLNSVDSADAFLRRSARLTLPVRNGRLHFLQAPTCPRSSPLLRRHKAILT